MLSLICLAISICALITALGLSVSSHTTKADGVGGVVGYPAVEDIVIQLKALYVELDAVQQANAILILMITGRMEIELDLLEDLVRLD